MQISSDTKKEPNLKFFLFLPLKLCNVSMVGRSTRREKIMSETKMNEKAMNFLLLNLFGTEKSQIHSLLTSKM